MSNRDTAVILYKSPEFFWRNKLTRQEFVRKKAICTKLNFLYRNLISFYVQNVKNKSYNLFTIRYSHVFSAFFLHKIINMRFFFWKNGLFIRFF